LNQNGSLIFILKGSANAIAGNFANAGAEDGNLTGFGTFNLGGQEFAISYTADFQRQPRGRLVHRRNDIALMAVPEPNSLAMLAGSLGMALACSASAAGGAEVACGFGVQSMSSPLRAPHGPGGNLRFEI